MTELTPEIQRVAETVEKLLRLAGKNASEAEAAAAAAKAQELLERHNLDMAVVEQAGGGRARRSDEKMSGGFYRYQRELWKAVADLHFCLYWSRAEWDPNKYGTQTVWHRGAWRRGGRTFRHRVVGRAVNVAATRVMAEYLEQVIERLTRERLGGDGSQFFTSWATSYREGVADRLIEKIYARRRDKLDEERRAKMEAERAAREAGRSEASTATGLTLSHYIDAETDANIDFVYGEGTSARWAAERAAAAAEARAEREAYTKWAAEHPEEAAAEEEKERRRRRRTSWNAGTGRDRRDYGGYYAGYEAGEKVGIDPQADHRSAPQIGRTS